MFVAAYRRGFLSVTTDYVFPKKNYMHKVDRNSSTLHHDLFWDFELLFIFGNLDVLLYCLFKHALRRLSHAKLHAIIACSDCLAMCVSL